MQSRLQDPRRRFHSVHDGVAMYARFRPQAVRIREAARSRQAADIDPTGGRAAACAPQARVEHDVLRHRPRRRQRRARSANVAACPGQRQHLYVVGDCVRSAAAPCAGGRRRGHAARSVTRRGAAQGCPAPSAAPSSGNKPWTPRAQQDAVLSRPALDVAGPVFRVRGVRRGGFHRLADTGRRDSQLHLHWKFRLTTYSAPRGDHACAGVACMPRRCLPAGTSPDRTRRFNPPAASSS